MIAPPFSSRAIPTPCQGAALCRHQPADAAQAVHGVPSLDIAPILRPWCCRWRSARRIRAHRRADARPGADVARDAGVDLTQRSHRRHRCRHAWLRTTLAAHGGSPFPVPLVKNSNTTCLNGRPFRADLTKALGRTDVTLRQRRQLLRARRGDVGRGARRTRRRSASSSGPGVGGGLVLRRGAAPARGMAPRASPANGGTSRSIPSGGDLATAGVGAASRPTSPGRPSRREYHGAADAATPRGDRRAPRRATRSPRSLSPSASTSSAARSSIVIDCSIPTSSCSAAASRTSTSSTTRARRGRPLGLQRRARTRIVKNELGDSAGVLGAALIAAPP